MAAVAAVGLALSVAQTLFSALQSKEVKEMCSMFRCESQLEKLQDTMFTIKAVLLDVESKRQGLTHEGQVWVEKLKDAVYDIDDLLDEFTTIAQQRKQDAKFSKKVGRFFSCNNKFFVSFNVSREIRLLREKLDSISDNHAKFGFTDVTKPVKRREETSSTISELEVFGREDDKEAIVCMLLSDQDHSSDQNVSYVSIVGIGGLGKTTLAQLVYNDERVKGAFSEMVWVCVSEEFSVEEILGKMLGEKDLTLEKMKTKVQSLLERKRYLLVLDDVWNESHDEWRKLKPYLVSDVHGSKIIITTRSKKVVSSIGKESILYELQGLTKENSWSLFRRIAFGKRDDQIDTELVNIGKVILKKCGNVPLSIRVVASLLYDQDKSQWRLFRDIELAKMCDSEDGGIMPTLMFSYYNLTPELKSCFSFCSLFPKDYVIRRELLISLWLAQGFLVVTHDCQSIEDVGEHYFTMLLNRCFFQDIRLDDHGEVETCKMHDLVHDLALQVAGKESAIITSVNEKHMRNKIRHISVYDRSKVNLCLVDTVRTYMGMDPYGSGTLSSEDVKAIISKGRHLRALDLSYLRNAASSNSFGRLLHLRYLDLSYNEELEMLPNSITKLHNLQTLKLTKCKKLKELPEDTSKLQNLRILKLSNCENLKELPENTSKLVNLRMLDIDECVSLTHMPRGMNNLKKLYRLPLFVVGGVDSKQVQGSKLVDLQALTSLKGELCVRIRDFSSNNMPLLVTKRAFLFKDVHNLKIICGNYYCDQAESVRHYLSSKIKFDGEADQREVHATLVEELCPNDDVRRIVMVGYEGMKLPSWASMIVNVKVSNVKGLQHVTSLSQLCHLKVVELKDLPNVEYIESDVALALVSTPNNESKVVFFPVLQKLLLESMPKLKGWWREARWEEMGGGGGCLVDASGTILQNAVSVPSFPCLHDLGIVSCSNMMYFPPCPHMKQLYIYNVNEALTFCMKGDVVASAVITCATSISGSRSISSDLQKLAIDDQMNSVLREFVGGAVENKSAMFREGFERCAASLRDLSIKIEEGWKLKGLGIQQLTNLQYLRVYGKPEEDDDEGMPWKYLQSLSSLQLWWCTNMVYLPKGLRYLGTSLKYLTIRCCNNMEELGECIGFLTSLQTLNIFSCHKLKSLPEAMRHLTSLTILYISAPSQQLRERCRKSDGEDWYKISHIPKVRIQ